eukprot:COSAG04_NODE_4628_length_1985_cov_1.364263_2_plen_207_part_01
MVYLSSPHRTSAAQLVHMDRLAPLWGPGPAAAVAAEDSAYLAARQAFAAAVQTASLKVRPFPLTLPACARCPPWAEGRLVAQVGSRLACWEIAVPLVNAQRSPPPLLPSGSLDAPPDAEPADEAELRSWSSKSQHREYTTTCERIPSHLAALLTPMPRCAPDYWARRKRHWEGLRLAKLQRAAREAGLWEAGSVEMLRDRLLRADYD